MFFSFYRLASYSHFFTKLRFLSNISSIAAAHTLLKIMKRPEKKIAKSIKPRKSLFLRTNLKLLNSHEISSDFFVPKNVSIIHGKPCHFSLQNIS